MTGKILVQDVIHTAEENDALEWQSIITYMLECAEEGAESASFWHVWLEGHGYKLRERGFSLKAEGDQIIVGWDRDTLARECHAVGYSCSWEREEDATPKAILYTAAMEKIRQLRNGREPQAQLLHTGEQRAAYERAIVEEAVRATLKADGYYTQIEMTGRDINRAIKRLGL